jgi:hypothetical protein
MPEPTLDVRLTTLQERVTRREAITDAVTVIRADIATIAEDIDPGLRQHVAELDDRVEKHALLMGRLLEATPFGAPPRERPVGLLSAQRDGPTRLPGVSWPV